ncbi:alpha/beta-type small acid-soluble spore protein [Paenibacillus protaetiae]|uniref:Alpha/beta-type small acid-soluble spore protein n=1 Tax=Paenibacillus protaetiae TaxID=2509456 RepID=A0A4P6EXG3_9BACL|nr:alpha/beta-type small acid-soluble spore protein [Paenibacillus protaetiae]QAY67742.1 alpha/beta-type small acid-soluble spore protein [Paenibacillus protaetiae]
MSRSNSNKVVIEGSRAALNQMKYEIAAEFGLTTGYAGGGMDAEFAGELGSVGGGQVNWSNLSTRQAGSVGGEITKRLIAQAEKVLHGL